MLLRRVLRRRLARVSVRTEVLRRVLRRGGGVIEGALKVLSRQKHAFSQRKTPFACTLNVFTAQNLHILFLSPRRSAGVATLSSCCSNH